MYKNNSFHIVYPICIGFNSLIILVTTCLIIIYVKVKDLHSYPCYFNILLSSVISINNISRLIRPKGESKIDIEMSAGCAIQAFILALFDKLMLTTMTIYSIVTFLGTLYIKFYKKYEKLIFISLILISFIISLILAILFVLNGVQYFDDICYVRLYPEEGKEIRFNKEIIDLIFTIIILVINFYCIIRLLIKIISFIRETINEVDKRKNYIRHFCKFLIIFILNNLTFGLVICIIKNYIEKDELKSLSYIILSLFVVLFYTLNTRVLYEGKKLICCQKDEEKDDNDEEKDEDEDAIEIHYISPQNSESDL